MFCLYASSVRILSRIHQKPPSESLATSLRNAPECRHNKGPKGYQPDIREYSAHSGFLYYLLFVIFTIKEKFSI